MHKELRRYLDTFTLGTKKAVIAIKDAGGYTPRFGLFLDAVLRTPFCTGDWPEVGKPWWHNLTTPGQKWPAEPKKDEEHKDKDDGDVVQKKKQPMAGGK